MAWGRSVVGADPRLHVQAPPFVGTWAPTGPGVRSLVPVAVAAVVIAFGPRWAAKAGWRVLLVATPGASIAWSVALATTSRWSDLTSPLATKYEYLAAVPRAAAPAQFLRTFVAQLSSFPTHVKGHPPGMVLVLAALERLGLGGPGWATALVLVVSASGAVAVLVAVDDVAERTVARRLAPFLVVVPAAVWTATSGDALFAGVGAWAVATGVQATSPRVHHRRTVTALSGALFAAVAMLSYGLVLLALVPIAVAAQRRRPGPIVAIGTTAGLLLLALAAGTGFRWWDGLAATRAAQLAGVAPRRPYAYFVVANLAALAVSIGPAAVGGLAVVRRRPAAPLVAGGLAAVVIADVSGFSKGEVERIWLPFVPWLVVGAANLSSPRRWLAGSAGVAILVQLWLRTPW